VQAGWEARQARADARAADLAPKSDCEIIWRGKTVKLRERVGLGTSRDPRHTIRIAFFFDDKSKRVVVGYIGPQQQN
jgi:hypothetical protein